MEPKLDRSVPKDQIAAMLCSMLISIAAGLAATYFVLGSKAVTLVAAGYALFGALEGGCDLNRHKLAGWIPIIVITLLLPFGFENFQVCRDAFAGCVSCITAGALIASYHFIKSAQDA